MAGVAVEIDLVLSQQEIARTIREAEAAGAAIGTGLAATASPAAQAFATKLLGTLNSEIQIKTEALAANLAAGIIDEAEFARQGTLAGQQFIVKLKQGIASGTKLGLFGDVGGAALQSQLTGLVGALERTTAAAKQAAPAVEQVAVAAKRVGQSGQGIGMVRNGLVAVALQATGTVGPLGRVVSGLLLFAGGSTVVLAVAAAVGVLALAFNKLNEGVTKSRNAVDQMIEKFKDFARSRLPEGQRLGLEIKDVQKEIDDLEKRLKAVRPTISGRIGEMITNNVKEDLERLAALKKILPELISQQTDVAAEKAKELAAKRNAMVVELTALVAASGDTAASAIIAQIGQLRAKFAELGKDLPAEMKAMFAKAMTALEAEFGATVVGESFVKQFRDIELSIVEGLGSAALQNIIGELDALRARIDSILATLPDSKAKNELETQRNAIIERRNQLQGKAVELASTENLIVHDSGETDDDRAKKLAARLALLEAEAAAIQSSAAEVLELAEAFGLADDNLRNIVTSIAYLVAKLPEVVDSVNKMNAAGKFDIQALPGIIGTIGAMFAGVKGLGDTIWGESPEAIALRMALESNERAIRDLSEDIKLLGTDISGASFLNVQAGVTEVVTRGQAQGRTDLGEREVDAVLHRLGTSLDEVREMAERLDVDLDQLTVEGFEQLQRAIQEADIADFTKTLKGRLDLFQRFAHQAGLTATETLQGIVAKAAGTSTAFDKIFEGLDLATKEGMEEAHKRILQALKDVPDLTAEMLGGLSVDQYLDLMAQTGDLIGQGLDDLAQKVAAAAAAAAQRLLEAADQQARQLNARRQWLDLQDRESPLGQIAGTAQNSLLQGILRGLDLTKEADRDILDQHLQRLFQLVNDGLLTAEQLGGMSREDFTSILLEWERLLDEERANEQARKEATTREQEQAAQDRQRAIEDRKRELEAQVREREARERDRLAALRDAQQELVDRRLAEEERKEVADLEKRARLLGGEPLAAIQRLLALLAEATLLEQGPLGEDSPLARDARRRADEARREAERLIEQGEKLLGDTITPGFTVQRTITESSAGRLIGAVELQTTWLQRIHGVDEHILQAILGQSLQVNVRADGGGLANGGTPRMSQPLIDAINRELAICYQRDALMSGNATMPTR